MVMVGFVTPVIIWVGSVTSTCLRSSFGDIRNLSGPMLPLSSGGLPGQICTTSGFSAPSAAHATQDHVARKIINANRIIDRKFSLRHHEQRNRFSQSGAWVGGYVARGASTITNYE